MGIKYGNVKHMAAGILLAVMFPFWVSCTDNDATESITRTGESEVISVEGGKVYVDVRAEGTWRVILPDDAAKWCTANPAEGQNARQVEIVLGFNEGADRSVLVKVTGDRWFDTVRIHQSGVAEDFTNVVKGRMEIPRLTGDVKYKLIDHQVAYKNQKLSNYCMEYALEKFHARWVAFKAYDLTAVNNVKRTDAWADDPEVPEANRTQKDDYNKSGYDRGHLVASADRLFCKEANEQTFYYSNMSPQLAGFNQKIWQKLEERVQNWMKDAALRDTLYVVKGGTIADGQLIEYAGVNSHVVVPKYYYMAILAFKDKQYKSIAFWLEHKDTYTTPYNLKEYAISIDDLETKTGIDFFPNLPGARENVVEKSFDTEDWSW